MWWVFGGSGERVNGGMLIQLGLFVAPFLDGRKALRRSLLPLLSLKLGLLMLLHDFSLKRRLGIQLYLALWIETKEQLIHYLQWSTTFRLHWSGHLPAPQRRRHTRWKCRSGPWSHRHESYIAWRRDHCATWAVPTISKCHWSIDPLRAPFAYSPPCSLFGMGRGQRVLPECSLGEWVMCCRGPCVYCPLACHTLYCVEQIARGTDRVAQVNLWRG